MRIAVFNAAGRSKDMRVQRNGTDENRQYLVNVGAILVFQVVGSLNSTDSDTDVQYYCTTAWSNITVDGTSECRLRIRCLTGAVM